MTNVSIYPGQELKLFENAIKWKSYFSRFIKPYLKGNILEVGAGLGSNTMSLNGATAKKWTLTEPDDSMALLLQTKINKGELPSNCLLVHGTLPHRENKEKYDTIIYIDVLEHIENDAANMEAAYQLLNKNGHLIILSPAFNFLYSNFDKSIGHYRRYSKKSLIKIMPALLSLVSIRYLDSTGFFLLLTNSFLAKKSYPTRQQVNFWNNYLIPVSRITDRLIFYSFGKTILGIWKKSA